MGDKNRPEKDDTGYTYTPDGIKIDKNDENGKRKITLAGETINVSQKGRKQTVETIINAETVADGNSVSYSFTVDNESKIFFAIAIDKQPWSCTVKTPYSGSANNAIYPLFNNVTSTKNINYPTLTMLTNYVDEKPSNWGEAEVIKAVYDGTINIINNVGDSSEATVTVKIIRVWE